MEVLMPNFINSTPIALITLTNLHYEFITNLLIVTIFCADRYTE